MNRRDDIVHALAQLLVGAAPQLRPPRAGGAVVGTPRNLPGLIPYGPQPQGLEQNSRFTGGSVPGGGMSLVHPPEPPSFRPRQFPPGFPQTPQAPRPPQPSIAPLLTGALGGGGGFGAGGAAGASGGPQQAAVTPAVRAGLGIGPGPTAQASPTQVRQQLVGAPVSASRAPSLAPSPAPTAPLVTAALLASLAQSGRKFQAV